MTQRNQNSTEELSKYDADQETASRYSRRITQTAYTDLYTGISVYCGHFSHGLVETHRDRLCPHAIVATETIHTLVV